MPCVFGYTDPCINNRREAFRVSASKHQDRVDRTRKLRNDEVYLDALGAPRIPDPTTAGDFCRRFSPVDVRILQDTIHQVRRRVWARQPASFFKDATLDVDGSLAETLGECKQGIGLAY